MCCHIGLSLMRDLKGRKGGIENCHRRKPWAHSASSKRIRRLASPFLSASSGKVWRDVLRLPCSFSLSFFSFFCFFWWVVSCSRLSECPEALITMRSHLAIRIIELSGYKIIAPCDKVSHSMGCILLVGDLSLFNYNAVYLLTKNNY